VVNSTPFRGLASPVEVWTFTLSTFTSRTASLATSNGSSVIPLSPKPRVEDVPDSVPEEVEPEGDDEDGETGEDYQPRGGEDILDALVHQVSELGDQRARRKADEGKRREGENHAPYVQRPLDDDGIDGVGNDVAEENPDPPRSHCSQRLDVRLLLLCEDLRPHEPHVRRPPGD